VNSVRVYLFGKGVLTMEKTPKTTYWKFFDSSDPVLASLRLQRLEKWSSGFDLYLFRCTSGRSLGRRVTWSACSRAALNIPEMLQRLEQPREVRAFRWRAPHELQLAPCPGRRQSGRSPTGRRTPPQRRVRAILGRQEPDEIERWPRQPSP